MRKSLLFSHIVTLVCLSKSAQENSAACFWRSAFPLHPVLSRPPELAFCTGAAPGWAMMWPGQCPPGRAAKPGGWTSRRKGRVKERPMCFLLFPIWRAYHMVPEGAIFLWQRSYGSFPSLTSKVLKLTAFYCFFSSSPLITWPPYIAAADKIYTWRKIPLNILFFTFSLFPNTTLKACNAKLHIRY